MLRATRPSFISSLSGSLLTKSLARQTFSFPHISSVACTPVSNYKILPRYYATKFSHYSPISEETKTIFTEAEQQLNTVGDLVRFALSRFSESGVVFGQGTQDIYEDSIFIIGKEDSTIHESNFFNVKVTRTEVKKVLDAIKTRIEKRLPAAYIVKKCIFNDFQFYVDERTIIPRSLIGEVITNGAVGRWLDQSPDNVTHILDMCTGSGFLAILLAHYFPNAQVTAVENISPDALAVAEINIKKFGLQKRVKLVQSDLFNKVDSSTKFDIIVSNPPYVIPEGMAELPIEFQYEPTNALGGGEDGLDFVRAILAQTVQLKKYDTPSPFSPEAFELCRLKENGIMIVEAGEYQKYNIQLQFPLGSTLVWVERMFLLFHQNHGLEKNYHQKNLWKKTKNNKEVNHLICFTLFLIP